MASIDQHSSIGFVPAPPGASRIAQEQDKWTREERAQAWWEAHNRADYERLRRLTPSRTREEGPPKRSNATDSQ